jgi:hypothetical protein
VYTKCVICHKRIETDSDEIHFFHDKTCPNHAREKKGLPFIDNVACDCDNPCHVECCPVCNPPVEELAPREALDKWARDNGYIKPEECRPPDPCDGGCDKCVDFDPMDC